MKIFRVISVTIISLLSLIIIFIQFNLTLPTGFLPLELYTFVESNLVLLSLLYALACLLIAAVRAIQKRDSLLTKSLLKVAVIIISLIVILYFTTILTGGALTNDRSTEFENPANYYKN
jgi:uncharacterized membrane protein YozB (DUF420 family)